MSIYYVGKYRLSGPAMNIFHRLYFNGPQEAQAVSEKKGFGELVELGLAECDYDRNGPPKHLTDEGRDLAEEVYRT